MDFAKVLAGTHAWAWGQDTHTGLNVDMGMTAGNNLVFPEGNNCVTPAWSHKNIVVNVLSTKSSPSKVQKFEKDPVGQ